jgi:anti-anti-sigma factor
MQSSAVIGNERRAGMIQLSVTNSGTLGIVTLRGRLSGNHAVELREHLLRGLHGAVRIIVNCEQLTSIDAACIRLLCTAYRVSRTQKKEFTLAGNRSHLFQRPGGGTAYPRCDVADRRCSSGCLWTDGDAPERECEGNIAA